MITLEAEFDITIDDVNKDFLETICGCFEKDEDYWLEDGLLREMRATWYEYVRPMHPRRDGQRKPYWLRVRSNPMRRGYH
nr:MAG TPA: hypothetical protein [Caudoviricetes sp.]